MSRNQSFVRKVIYIACIALLLLPLSALSQPATVGPKGQPELGSRGGKLSQLRERYNLAQANLGEIDPASETMKLASLGLRGVAANILWGYAHHYKKVEDWDKVELTVNQIIRLQPNFLKVWDFQSHNLSYNISTEFDDYRMRYFWVKKGIAFLIDGTNYNRNEPGMLSNIGWFVGQKIGRADEKIQFRRMFKDDGDFHQLFRENGVEVDQIAAHGPDSKPDNWLVSRLWYQKASDAVTSLGKPIRGMAPVLFYGRVPMSQINASDAMQRDGFFFEVAQTAWEKSAEEWRSFGDQELPAASGISVRMNDQEALEQHVQQLRDEIDKVVPGFHARFQEEKLPLLSPEQRAVLAKPAEERTLDDKFVMDFVNAIVIPRTDEILKRVPRESLPKVRGLVDQMVKDENELLEIRRNRNVVAFEYWRTRVEAERTTEARQARSDVYNANKLYAQGEKFDEARKLYERAWDAWANLFREYPELMGNAEAQDLIESISNYRDLLGQLDQPFPADFKLNDLLDMHYDGQQLRERIRLIQGSGEPAGKPPESKPPESDPNKPDDATKPLENDAPAKPEKSDGDKTDESKADKDKDKSDAEPAEKSDPPAKPAEGDSVESKP